MHILHVRVFGAWVYIRYIPHMDVSKNRGTPKWMVKIMENPIKSDDLGVPLFLVQHPYGFSLSSPNPPK